MRDTISLLVEALPWVSIVGLALYLASKGQLGTSALQPEQISLATLGLVGGVALAQLVDRLRVFHRIDRTVRNIDRELPLRAITGLARFNKSRSKFAEIGDISSWIAGARKEIFVAGGALANTVRTHGQLLMSKAEQGCKVRLLLANPRSRDGEQRNPVAEAMSENYAHPDFCGAIEDTLDDLEHLLTSASARARKNVQVRLYNCVQTLSMCMVDDDRNAKTGRMLVEILIYGKRTWERPSLEFTQHNELFGRFRDAYRQNLWTRAIPWYPADLG